MRWSRVTDRIHARGLGVDLEDSQQLRSVIAQRDSAFKAVAVLLGTSAAARQSSLRFRRRWVITLGLLLGVLLLDAGVMLWLMRVG